ncbi:MAG: hypothetical protein P4L40_04160 [Terracidiphilus sp.]|nr:hypothetical protein [Terracidiphilus sp.]
MCVRVQLLCDMEEADPLVLIDLHFTDGPEEGRVEVCSLMNDWFGVRSSGIKCPECPIAPDDAAESF